MNLRVCILSGLHRNTIGDLRNSVCPSISSSVTASICSFVPLNCQTSSLHKTAIPFAIDIFMQVLASWNLHSLQISYCQRWDIDTLHARHVRIHFQLWGKSFLSLHTTQISWSLRWQPDSSHFLMGVSLQRLREGFCFGYLLR